MGDGLAVVGGITLPLGSLLLRKRAASGDISMIRRVAAVALGLISAAAGCATVASDPSGLTQDIAEAERMRLRALVTGDIDAARDYHADEFELITPNGAALTKEAYLEELASGRLDYVVWEPGEIVVRVYGDVAVLRYQDVEWQVFYDGNMVNQGRGYHTNVYELRNGRWQVVWSQASGALPDGSD